MNESFSVKRFISLFIRSANRKDKLFRIAILIFVFIQLGWLKSKSTLNQIESMNSYIFTSLFVFNFMFYHIIIKQGVTQFLLLPARVLEKFLYIFTTVFGGAFAFSFLMFTFAELSSRVIFSVSQEWFAFDYGFAIWMTFTTTILFFIQFVFLKKLNAKAFIIVLSVIIVSTSIFIDNYFIEHFAPYTPIRLWLYAILSVGFIGAAYLKFVKCEATLHIKS